MSKPLNVMNITAYCVNNLNALDRQKKTAIEFFINETIYIKPGARCCSTHIDSDSRLIINDKCMLIFNETSTEFTSEQMINMIDRVRNEAIARKVQLDTFDTSSESDCITFIGFSKEQIRDFKSKWIRNTKNSANRSENVTLCVYLTKLKCGLTNKELVALFKLDVFSVERAIKAIRSEPTANLVNRKLGFANFSRATLKDNMTTMVTELFDVNHENVAILADGTYIYIEKGANNQFQRLT